MLEKEHYTPKQAAQHAIEWCKNHKGWKRICDIENADNLYKSWDELSERERRKWIYHYRNEDTARGAWEELGKKPCKVPYGFISGKGEFYRKVTDVPPNHNLMMVFKVD